MVGATITPRSAGLGFPINFALQTSNDAQTWTDVPGEVQTGFSNPGSTPVVRTFGMPILARYLRLYATRLGADNYGKYYLQLGELVAHVAP